MDLPFAKPGHALSQATRARLFALLGELRRPAATDELAHRLGLHPNGVRIHLERMREAGLVERRRAPHGRGRPRDEWSVSPEAEPGGRPPRAYGDLALWLARAIPARPGRIREIQQAGRDFGRELAPRDADSAETGLRETLTWLGCRPVLERTPGGGLQARLRNCPYRESVKENQPVVCALHRGITEGVLGVLDPGARLTAFVPKDPERAGCEIEVEGLGTADARSAR